MSMIVYEDGVGVLYGEFGVFKRINSVRGDCSNNDAGTFWGRGYGMY